MSQTAAKVFKGEEPAGLGGVGYEEEVEGQVAQWVADNIRRGREEKARLEAGTCHRHHGDASESPCSPG